MTISVTNLGTTSNTSGATLPFTIPAGGVPAGATIFVITGEGNNIALTTGGSMADSKSNSYASANKVELNSGSGVLNLFAAPVTTPLVSGDTVTFTKQASGDNAALSAFYATGLSTQDTAVSATSSALTSTPSVTSGTPTVAGDLIIAACGVRNNATVTPITNDGTWTNSPPTAANSGSGNTHPSILGGYQINAGTGTKTYAPTFNAAQFEGCLVVGFFAAAIHSWTTPQPDQVKRRPSSDIGPSFISTASTVPIVGPSGVAWSQRFEEFRGKPKQTNAPAYGIPPVPAVGISGVAWSERLDYAIPRKGRTDPQAIILSGIPAVGPSGIAWSQRIDYATPRKGRTDPAALDPKVTPAVGVSGIPWSQRFEPFYGRPIRFTTPQGFAHRGVPAVGLSGVAWSERYEQVFYGRKAYTTPIGWAVSPQVIRFYPPNRALGAIPKWRFLG